MLHKGSRFVFRSGREDVRIELSVGELTFKDFRAFRSNFMCTSNQCGLSGVQGSQIKCSKKGEVVRREGLVSFKSPCATLELVGGAIHEDIVDITRADEATMRAREGVGAVRTGGVVPEKSRKFKLFH